MGQVLSTLEGGNFNLLLEDGGTLAVQVTEQGSGPGTVDQVTATAPLTVSPGTSGASVYNLALETGEQAGTYGDATHVASMTVDAQGLVTAAESVAIDFPGSVTAVTATSPLVSSGGDTPNLMHAASGAAAGTYGDDTHVATFTVNASGHLTAAEAVAIAFPVTSVSVIAPLLNAGSSSAPDIGLIAPVEFWQTNAGAFDLTGTPETVATVTLTPAVSGRFFIQVNAQVENTDSSNINQVLWEISNSHDANTFEPFPTNISIGQDGSPYVASVGFNVCLDQTPTPSVFTLGTGVTFTLRAAANTSGVVAIPIAGLQVYWQERLA